MQSTGGLNPTSTPSKHFFGRAAGAKTFFALLTIALCTILLADGATAAPTVTVISPNGGETLTGVSPIIFTVADSSNPANLSANIFYSNPPGMQNNVIAPDLNVFSSCEFSTGYNFSAIDFNENLPTGAQRGIGELSFVYLNGKMHMIHIDNVITGTAQGYRHGYTWNNATEQWDENNSVIQQLPVQIEFQDSACWADTGNIRWGQDTFAYNGKTYWIVYDHCGTQAQIAASAYKAFLFEWDGNTWQASADDYNKGLKELGAADFFGSTMYFRIFEWNSELYAITTSGQNPSAIAGITNTAVLGGKWNAATHQWSKYNYIVNDFNTSVQWNSWTIYNSPENELFALFTPPYGSTLSNVLVRKFDTITGSWKDANADYSFTNTTGANAKAIDIIEYPAIYDGYFMLMATSIVTTTVPRIQEAFSFPTLTAGTQLCTYSWDVMTAYNGNWYIDVNVSNGISTSLDSSDDAFLIAAEGGGLPPYTPPVGIANKVGIYIVASDAHEGKASGGDATLYSGFMHNYAAFKARETGYYGWIQIDGAIRETCNRTWDCQLDLNTGSHSYALYSAIGNYPYTGTFNIDANTRIIKLYVPLTYNIFELFNDSSRAEQIACSGIYSLDADFSGAMSNKRIGAGLDVNGTGTYQYWDSSNVIPKNCYSELMIPQFYPYALPANKPGIEPAVFAYSGANGLMNGELFGWHMLKTDITGTRHRNGNTNFYSLYSKVQYYPGSGGAFSGAVEQKQASYEDGYYSPIVSIAKPSMNIDSALYGDANYVTGDFALGDNVTCEAALQSHGFAVYDVNFALISDQNTLYSFASFSPYQKYNSYMQQSQPSGAFNIAWHTFADVNIGHSGYIQCAVQTTNELGFKSGWAISPLRRVWATNYSATEGISILVKDEDGTVSQMRHKSPNSGDVNKIDLYNFWHAPYFWEYYSSQNPLTLFEGEGIIAQTKDSNSNRTASKSFNIDRGDVFSISLFLPDLDAQNQAPVAFKTTMQERSATGEIICKTYFYDKDLDWNSTVFKFWTSQDGSLQSPNCTQAVGYAYTSNCNPADVPCLAPAATASIMNECGSTNDCYVQAKFGKRGCTAASPSSSITGTCAMQLYDNNGNSVLVTASGQITVESYGINADCRSYAIANGKEEPVIYTTEDKGYVECSLYLDSVAHPDSNFSLVFEGKPLQFLKSEWDDYMGRETLFFREEVTAEIDALARRGSTDSETWEGDGTVFITHPVYGAKDRSVHIAAVIIGSRVEESTDYGENQFGTLFDWIDSLAKGMLTDPAKTITTRFFDVLLIVIGCIIFIPLLIGVAYVYIALEKNRSRE